MFGIKKQPEEFDLEVVVLGSHLIDDYGYDGFICQRLTTRQSAAATILILSLFTPSPQKHFPYDRAGRL